MSPDLPRRAYLGAVAAAAGLSGCADGGRTPTPTPGTGTPTEGETGTPTPGGSTDSPVRIRAETVARELTVPWGLDWLDGVPHLTERPGRIVRVVDGRREPVADLTASTADRGEGGLLGLAFVDDAAFVYQTTDAGGRLRNRVRRYDAGDWTGEEVLDDIPASSIHDGGRLFVHDDALFVTCGDAGDAQRAQDRTSLNGTVLRLTLSGDPHPDNPFDSAVFSYGHRNPQGLAARDGELYAAEHGPDTDDEVNRLEAGRNYGWPTVRGKSGDDRFADPLVSWTPTVAPGGAAFYPADGAITQWRDELFVPTLKGSHLRKLTISDGTVTTDQPLYRDEWGRLRTANVGPDGHLYVTTSNRDGRGDPRPGDDRLLRFRPA